MFGPTSEVNSNEASVFQSGLPADELAFLDSVYSGPEEPPTDEELERQHVATRTVRYSPRVDVKGRKFAAVVEASDGHRFKAGTHTTESAAWLAAQRLAAELASDTRAA